MAVFAAAVISSLTLAQQAPPVQADVTVAPPPMEFPQWKEVSRTEFSAVYEQRIVSPVTTPWLVNNTYTIKAYVPLRSAPVPVAILLHYWGAADNELEASEAKMLNDKGIAAVVIPLPYHLGRTPESYKSGQLAITSDISRFSETMEQSVLDVRRVIDWIQSRKEFNPDEIAVGGTSLGSLVAILAFGVDERIKAASFMLGGVDLAHILWRSSAVTQQRDSLRRRGYTEEKVRLELEPVEPSRFLRKDDPRPTFVIGAKHDTVIPPESTDQLIALLNDPEVLWLDTGHYGGFVVQNRILRTIARFFEDTLNGKDFEAPKTFYSPTIRLGFNYNPDSQLQVAAGLDVWHTGPHDEGFASILGTPRGIQGFVGYRLSKELAIGASLTRKRTTWGIFWSIVL
jgi:dienelactone hydrolase